MQRSTQVIVLAVFVSGCLVGCEELLKEANKQIQSTTNQVAQDSSSPPLNNGHAATTMWKKLWSIN